METSDFVRGHGVMDLENLSNSTYLKHPIWFLSTMRNSHCVCLKECCQSGLCQPSAPASDYQGKINKNNKASKGGQLFKKSFQVFLHIFLVNIFTSLQKIK